ncbi:hypothetical protein [Thermoanaerobacter sp. RKWS2]|uniref:hypothetical protein n=1 Tax=Thermoanaerobacter sp. RKWS2 TaxID=2983842 RepID=UPI00224B6317|nr:hypothetical protein [Thermoanaerobacter sp. RKWS2]UZQ83949.1 hypothetical protein OEI98_001106 [Thermoanaerobacter sp. RKWS2]
MSLEEFAKKYWPLLGIDDVSRQKLINKIKKGEILDAYRPEMQAKAKVETFTRVNDKGALEEVTKLVYPDGSVNITTKEILKEISPTFTSNDISPLVVDPGTGTVRCGTGYCSYTHIKVSHVGMLVAADFYADFVIVNGGYDYISKVYDHAIAMVGTIVSRYCRIFF